MAAARLSPHFTSYPPFGTPAPSPGDSPAESDAVPRERPTSRRVMTTDTPIYGAIIPQ